MAIQVSGKAYKDIVKKVGKEKMAELERNSNEPSTSGEIVKVKVERKENALDKNTAKIEELHNTIVGMLCKSLEKAIEIGGLMFEQKEIVQKNDVKYTRWAKEHLPFNIRTAQRYMKLYLYREALRETEVKTITEAYAYIFGEPTSDEIIDADDSMDTTDISVKASVNLDKLELPKKKAKGMMKKLVLTNANIDGMISGRWYKDCQGMYVKIVVELKSGSVINKRIGEFVCAAEKYLRPGGKIIFHKK